MKLSYEYSKQQLVTVLNALYPELEIKGRDIATVDGQFTIDGMDPHEWCEAMMED